MPNFTFCGERERKTRTFFNSLYLISDTSSSWIQLQKKMPTFDELNEMEWRQRQRQPQKKQLVWWSKQQLCTRITILGQFLCLPCTTTTWNGQILSLPKNGTGKAINSTISVWTRARVPSLHFQPKFPFLSNRATWDNREIVSKDAKSISISRRRFHGCRRCRIVRSLVMAWLSITSSSMC